MTVQAVTLHHALYNNCRIKSYSDMSNWFSHARSKAKGRPFKTWCLVKREGNAVTGQWDYVVAVHRVPVVRLTSDNKLTFLIGPTEGRDISPTLSSGLHKLVPVSWTRVGKLQYRSMALSKLTADESWWAKQDEAPEVFKGLQLDLTSGEFVNAKPDMLKRIDSDARKVWLKALRNFKKDMTVRAKLGVFDGISAKLDADKQFKHRTPKWHEEEWSKKLYECMRDRDYPTAFLAGIALTVPRVIWGTYLLNMTPKQKIETTVAYLISVNRNDLRTRFGVFSDEVTSDD